MFRAARASRIGGHLIQVAAVSGRWPEGSHTFSQPDLFVVATALHHGLTIVTPDTTEYAKARIAILNPWIDNDTR
jgi:predicted nucleic acid-binding protein